MRNVNFVKLAVVESYDANVITLKVTLLILRGHMCYGSVVMHALTVYGSKNL